MRTTIILIIGLFAIQSSLLSQNSVFSRVDSSINQYSQWTSLSGDNQSDLSIVFTNYYTTVDSVTSLGGLYTEDVLISLKLSLDSKISSILSAQQLDDIKSGLAELSIRETADSRFNANFASFDFTQEEEKKIKSLLYDRTKEQSVVAANTELSESQKFEANQAIIEKYIPMISEVKRNVRFRAQSKQKVEEIDSLVRLAGNQELQLQGIYFRYYSKVTETYGYPSAKAERDMINADLFRKTMVVLTDKQQDLYFKSQARELAQITTDEQIPKVAAQNVYTETQLAEFKEALFQYNLKMEVIKVKYKFETDKKLAELKDHRKSAPQSVKRLLAISRGEVTKEYVGTYQWTE